MGDMMATDPIRVYFIINTGTLSPNETQWNSLFQQMKVKTLEASILAVAQGRGAQCFITHNKRSQNAAHLLKNTLCGFEVDRAAVDDLLIVLNAEAALISATGTARAKFVAVLQNDMRVAARDLGYTVTQSNQLTCTVVGFGARDVAIAEAQSYLAANGPAIWWAAV
jgi:hypothetical protein